MKRRLKGFLVTPECIAQISRRCEAKTIRIDSLVPETAQFFSAWFDHEKRSFVCVFEDESFGEVYEGAAIPVIYGPEVTEVR